MSGPEGSSIKCCSSCVARQPWLSGRPACRTRCLPQSRVCALIEKPKGFFFLREKFQLSFDTVGGERYTLREKTISFLGYLLEEEIGINHVDVNV